MKLYLGLIENSALHQTRVFVEAESKLVDLKLALSQLDKTNVSSFPTVSHPDGSPSWRTAALADAKKELEARSLEFGITAIEEIKDTADGESFLSRDLDRNWWQIAYLNN